MFVAERVYEEARQPLAERANSDPVSHVHVQLLLASDFDLDTHLVFNHDVPYPMIFD